MDARRGHSRAQVVYMLRTKYYKLHPYPCGGCANRTPGCTGNCPIKRDYDAEMTAWIQEKLEENYHPESVEVRRYVNESASKRRSTTMFGGGNTRFRTV